MDDMIGIKGTYSDFKLVKTRSVCQVIIEIPIEQSETFVQKFGIPNTHSETWVAIAKLQTQNHAPPDQQVVRSIQKAGILCKDENFGRFMKEVKGYDSVDPKKHQTIQDCLRAYLGVRSRTDMHTDKVALGRFDSLSKEYFVWNQEE